MAYPVVSAPYGLKPINLVGGQVFAGSTRQIPIASGNANPFYNGDIVQYSGGTLVPTSISYNTASFIAGTVGVFLGCSYTNQTTGQKTFANALPASIVANDIVAYVEDDPDAVFQAAVLAYSTTTSSTLVALSQAYVGTNLFYNSTNTPSAASLAISPLNANSAQSVQVTSNGARLQTTAPFRIVGLVPESAITVNTTGTVSSGSASLVVASNAGLNIGMQVINPAAYPAGAYAYITGISGTTITVNGNAAAATTSAPYTFYGCPEVKVKWNFGYHSYYAAAGV